MPVEREDHLRALHRMFSECRAGQGRVAVVTGPVACGKTELLHAFTAHPALAEATVLGAVGSRAEREVALGVVGQLFCSARLEPEQSGRAAELVRDFHAGDENTDRLLHGIGLTLLHALLPARAPVVLTVDDAHHADQASLQCLTSIVRRLRSVPIMVVLTQVEHPWPTNPAFHAELPPEPLSRRLRLAPLSPRGVGALLAQELNLPAARRLAARCHALSGGNPLLLRGLIEDNREQAPAADPAVGPAYSQALLNGLYRCEESMLRLAHAAAVLDESTGSPSAARLAGLDDEAARRAAATLDRTGLLDAGLFRHAAGRAAVLDDLGRDERADLHRRAARLLRQEGAPATSVARHLIGAQDAGAPGDADELPILLEAAELARAAGDLDTQLTCLRLACEAAGPGPARARALARLARAEWRVDPAIGFRHTPALLEDLRQGRLCAGDGLALTHRLMWFGHEAEAADVLRRLRRDPAPPDPRTAAKVRAMAGWLRHVFPDRARPGLPSPPPGDAAVTRVADPYGRAAVALSGVLAQETRAEAVRAAEQILQGSRLEEDTFTLICWSLATLNLADRQPAAASWCEQVLEEPQVLRNPTWHAVLTGLRARVALLQGSLAEAEEYARTALEVLPVRSWGVLAGLPLSVLVEACIGLGRLDEACEHVRTPLPPGVLRTPVGLVYLQARARFHYAGGHYQAALADAQSAGELAGRWRLDRPALTDWRTDAARVALAMDLPDQARELAEEQLALLGPSDVRVRARTDRLLAACARGAERTELLRRAVQGLRGVDARLELAYATVDLARAQHAEGRPEAARQTFEQARQLARRCGVPDPLETRPRAADAAASCRPAGDGGPTPLSDAELRVAVLAARGRSNRQIAAELFVTVSTVEQHLTRVYRKLNVNSRSDLPLYLHSALADSA